MSIASLVTRGFSNGPFTGSIAEIVTIGYTIGEDLGIWTDKPAVITSWGGKLEVSTTYTIKPPVATIWTDKT